MPARLGARARHANELDGEEVLREQLAGSRARREPAEHRRGDDHGPGHGPQHHAHRRRPALDPHRAQGRPTQRRDAERDELRTRQRQDAEQHPWPPTRPLGEHEQEGEERRPLRGGGLGVRQLEVEQRAAEPDREHHRHARQRQARREPAQRQAPPELGDQRRLQEAVGVGHRERGAEHGERPRESPRCPAGRTSSACRGRARSHRASSPRRRGRAQVAQRVAPPLPAHHQQQSDVREQRQRVTSVGDPANHAWSFAGPAPDRPITW